MSVNKVILIGNVGKTPEIRDASGTKVASLTLATSDKGYTKQDGTVVPERTEWHQINVWGRLADVVERFIDKGTKLYVEGSLHTRSWEKDGVKHYSTEISAEKIEMLGGKPQDKPQTQAQGSISSMPF